MDARVAIVLTDARHTPSGLVLPFHRHRARRIPGRCASRNLPREATANESNGDEVETYHGEIGREATAPEHKPEAHV
jgi:hypothetical protein